MISLTIFNVVHRAAAEPARAGTTTLRRSLSACQTLFGHGANRKEMVARGDRA
jgi:hypothetical protein